MSIKERASAEAPQIIDISNVDANGTEPAKDSAASRAAQSRQQAAAELITQQSWKHRETMLLNAIQSEMNSLIVKAASYPEDQLAIAQIGTRLATTIQFLNGVHADANPSRPLKVSIIPVLIPPKSRETS